LTEVTLTEVRDFAALQSLWRGLEPDADLSFFQSWTWIGCRAAERFPDPVLAHARDNGETIGLALFNRRGGRLFLAESGIPAFDRLAMEYNGPVVRRDRPDARAAILRAAAARHDLVLGAMTVRPPGLLVKTQPAPFARLDPAWFSRRGANTRQQIQRSDRAFGPLTISRAEDEATAHEWLDEMAVLHQATWTARGKPGAFADPFFARFHHDLIRHGLPRREVELWRIAAPDRLAGILYNFRFRGHVLAYQSGFAYDPANPRLKPGLTCHRQVIAASLADGATVYNFLAGDDRYKRSLADGADTLHWALAGPWWSTRLLSARLRSIASRARDAWMGRS
jgi:CelD/BcsL family acetyltransferase involved in cellulose biosynthesis